MDFISERVLQSGEDAYPENLEAVGIKSSLYTLGDFKFDEQHLYIGVIGCRKPSVYGQIVTQKLVRELVYNSCVIVSGFMYGIDLEAHNAAVDAAGKTICVLGYGLDHLKKTVPEYLIERFASSGCFLTEYEYNIAPKKWTFANRNKIIAGLCSLLIVIEAEQKSGSFITCNWAKKFNKPVFAVPGSILSEKSIGTNRLIKEGSAELLSSIFELSASFNKTSTNDIYNSKLTGPDRELLSNLAAGPLTFDQIAALFERKYNFDFFQVSQLVSNLELHNFIQKEGNTYYVL